jgi:putative ABC transport system substrate-binding protein
LLKIQLNILEVRDPAQLDAAFSTMVRERSDAVMVLAGVYLYAHRSRIAELTMKHKLPSILNSREYVEAGGRMVYAANSSNLMSRSATYVDKILKGAKPADVPVEQPTKLDLVINLKTAKALNLSIPQSILLRVDDVIE